MKVKKSELEFSKSINVLDSCKSNTNEVNEALKSFINDKNVSGSTYDQVKAVMAEYIGVFDSISQISEKLSSSILSSTSNMKSYMEDYEEINDDKKEEIRQELNALDSYIYSANEKINNISDDEESQKLKWEISSYYEQRNKLDKILKKIEMLSSVDSHEYGQLSAEVTEELSKLNSKINGINDIVVN